MEDKNILDNPSIRLRVLRKVLSLKQLTLGQLVDVSLSTIVKWEKRSLVLKPCHKERLRYVGINSQWVEYGTGEPFSIAIDKVKHNIFFTLKRGK